MDQKYLEYSPFSQNKPQIYTLGLPAVVSWQCNIAFSSCRRLLSSLQMTVCLMHFATHTFQHPHEFSAPENMHMGGGVDDWVTGYPVWVLRPKSKLQHIGLVNNLTIIYTTNLFTNFAIRLRVFRCSCSSMPQSMRSVIAYVISIPATILATSRTGTCTA